MCSKAMEIIKRANGVRYAGEKSVQKARERRCDVIKRWLGEGDGGEGSSEERDGGGMGSKTGKVNAHGRRGDAQVHLAKKRSQSGHLLWW